MAGRKKDGIWVYFIEESTSSGKGAKATCRICGLQMMGIVARMKKHKEKCASNESENETTQIVKENKSFSQENNQLKRKAVTQLNIATPSKRIMDNYVIKTSDAEKVKFDEQIARYVYATNSPFRCVENSEFKKMISVLHPGYIPPTKEQVSGILLDSVYQQEKEKCMNKLAGQTVSMSLDGWSNIHNEPVICVSVATVSGEIQLVDSIDTSGNSHNTEYLVKIANDAILKCEIENKCFVRSLVTDNASNVKSMRNELNKDKKLDLITYGCSAHLLNLLSNDIKIPGVKEHVVQIIKYFRNNHFANAKFKEGGSTKLILPNDVRWNTVVDSLSSYIKNWPILLSICENYRSEIDNSISDKIKNIGLKRNVEDFLAYLKPISIALDSIQTDNCTISSAVHIWKKLEINLKELKVDDKMMKSFITRYNQALGAPHFLAYLIDPRYCGKFLTDEEKKEAMFYAKEKYSSFLPLLIKYQAKADPFYNFLFDDDVVNQVSPLEWWKTHCTSPDTETVVAKVTKQLLTASASTSSLERIFSTYSLIQSNLRNRLGNEKASKLLFLFKSLNKKLG